MSYGLSEIVQIVLKINSFEVKFGKKKAREGERELEREIKRDKDYLRECVGGRERGGGAIGSTDLTADCTWRSMYSSYGRPT